VFRNGIGRKKRWVKKEEKIGVTKRGAENTEPGGVEEVVGWELKERRTENDFSGAKDLRGGELEKW